MSTFDAYETASQLTELIEVARPNTPAALLQTMLQVGTLEVDDARYVVLCAVFFLSCLTPEEIQEVADKAINRLTE
jgi:hypothetical protein